MSAGETGNRGFRLYRRGGKRFLDLALTVPLLLVLLPVIAMVALLVRLRLGAPVLFRQQRPGWHSVPFVVYKFRTMNDKRDDQGALRPDAQRLTSLGRFLRRTSLDELPELFNVLRGDMSLVGPRPLLMEYLERYDETQRRRHEVRPGLTGWAQIHGRNDLEWPEKFALDVWYVDHYGFYLDLKILLKTFFRVAGQRGVNKRGHATTEKFMGNERNE